ncbi:MAG: hypothetical protein ACOH5I_15090 [Oligoflexus sp.]
MRSLTVWHFTIPLVLAFSAITWDRSEHLVWALAFTFVPIAIYILITEVPGKRSSSIKKAFSQLLFNIEINKYHSICLALFVAFLGSWISDIDWLFKIHRSPITHSIAPYLLMVFVIKQSRSIPWLNHSLNEKFLVIFGYGLSSHLISDIIPGGNVVGLPASIDMPFLFLNGIATGILAFKLHKKLLSSA